MRNLFHTTSLRGLADILSDGELRAKYGAQFVSFGEAPVFGDITGKDVVLVFDANRLRPYVDKVEYTRKWFDAHREQAAYIAGEAWAEQFSLPDYADYPDYDPDDPDWEPDPDTDDALYADAEFNAFEDKAREREWISKTRSVPLNGLLRVLVANGQRVDDVRAAMKDANMGTVEVGALRESLDETTPVLKLDTTDREDYARAWVPINSPRGVPNAVEFTPYRGSNNTAGVLRWNDDRGIGRGILSFDPSGATNIAVQKSWRGKGVADRLWKEANARGVWGVSPNTTITPAALKFFTKRGVQVKVEEHVNEGARDAERRRYALTTFNTVTRRVREGKIKLRTVRPEMVRWQVNDFGLFYKRPDDQAWHVPEDVLLMLNINHPAVRNVSSGYGSLNANPNIKVLIIDVTQAWYSEAQHVWPIKDGEDWAAYVTRLYKLATVDTGEDYYKVRDTLAECLSRSSTRVTFIHEYTHMLDDVRMIPDKPVGDTLKAAKVARASHTSNGESGLDDYFRTSTEYNAFYQSIAAVFDHVLKQLDQLESEKSVRVVFDGWFGNFAQFRRQFERSIIRDRGSKGGGPDTQWYTSIMADPKWKQRFLKRLYMDWTRSRDEVEKYIERRFPHSDITERINGLLHEGSWTYGDLPKKFILVFEFFPSSRRKMTPSGDAEWVPNRRVSKAVLQLSKGKLDGVRGISGGGEIILDFMGLGQRNAFLVMDPQDVVRENSVTRVMYNNPKYLLSNNMAALRRILSGASIHRAIQAIGMYGRRYGAELPAGSFSGDADTDSSMFYALDYGGMFDSAGGYISGGRYASEEPIRPIRNAGDIADMVIEFANKTTDTYEKKLANWDRKAWIKFIELGAKKQAEVYGDEKEWGVKDGTFNVPQGSTLYIAAPPPSKYTRMSDDELRDLKADSNKWLDVPVMERAHIEDVIRHRVVLAAVKRFGLDRLYKVKDGLPLSSYSDRRTKRAVRKMQANSSG